MKSFTFCKLPLILLTIGGALLIVPQARAQSEIAPDHFDGTDSWAAAASAKAPASKAKPHSAPASLQARNNTPSAPTVQPVAAREITTPRRTSATKKRTTPKSSN